MMLVPASTISLFCPSPVEPTTDISSTSRLRANSEYFLPQITTSSISRTYDDHISPISPGWSSIGNFYRKGFHPVQKSKGSSHENQTDIHDIGPGQAGLE